MEKPYWLKTDPSQWSSIEAALEREKARMAREMEWDNLFHRHEPRGNGEPLEHNWIIENFLPREYVMLLGGPPDAGKGCFTTALAKAVAKGEDFAGMKTTQGPVLWVAMEECYGERKELFNHDPEFLKEEIDIWTCYLRHAPIDTDEGFDSLKYWARKTSANLIVIDPLYAAVSNCNLSEGHYARRAMQRLKHLAYEMNCAIIVLHQVNRGKAQRIADSIQLQATASINAVFSRVPIPPPLEGGGQGEGEASQPSHKEAVSSTRVTIRTTGRGMFANATHRFQSTGPLNFTPWHQPERTEAEPPKEVNENEEKIIEAIAKGHRTASEIVDHTALRPGTVRNLLHKLCEEERIICTMRISGVNRYSVRKKIAHNVTQQQVCTGGNGNGKVEQPETHPSTP